MRICSALLGAYWSKVIAKESIGYKNDTVYYTLYD